MTDEFFDILVMSAVFVAVALVMTRCGSDLPKDFTEAPQCMQNALGQMICRVN